MYFHFLLIPARFREVGHVLVTVKSIWVGMLHILNSGDFDGFLHMDYCNIYIPLSSKIHKKGFTLSLR